MLLFYQTQTLYVGEAAPEGVVTSDDIADALDTLVKRRQSVQLVGVSEDDFLAHLKRHFLFIEAAGGIVSAPDGRTLLINRNDRWDLPKGKVEDGESTSQAALREVSEETGVENLTIGPLLTSTFHIYNTYGDWTLKQTWWYLMTTHLPSPTKPQSEEGITQAVWLTPQERHQALQSSYSMMRHLDNLLTPLHTFSD
ncbi:MAG: NUDIX domain-containing protein [Bacteroidales bacterium]|nr:NUDIX domain-containing protein [Bacteroidales bacterium]